jgi:formylmethanofuran dehydrogenase subunit D
LTYPLKRLKSGYNTAQLINVILRGKSMAETMTLIAGRSSKQGTSLNAGKLKEAYVEVTTTVEMNEEDMARLGLQNGDQVRLQTDVGQAVVRCKSRKATDLPAGMLFMAYGPASSQLMDGDTAGTGMPISKHLDVEITPMIE